ncbi:reverse transcriptase domain-containing protein, partial [Tanacetum coccineum]
VVEEDGPIWMTPIIEYLKEGTLPDDIKEANKLRIKARQYELLEGIIYRRSFLKPWLQCVGPLQADYVIREIHEGSCSMHAGPRSVVAKVMRLGYYWPTMHRDVRDMIRKLCRFGLLGEIVSDNGKQFSDNPFKDWCLKLNITQRFASVKHPQSNGLVERANMSLGEGIKARLEVVIHAEVRMPTYRTAVVDAVHNDEELRLNLDLLEERRERAAIREAKAKLKMTNHVEDGGKLSLKWEGPYDVTEALEDGAYKLRSMDETVLLRT